MGRNARVIGILRRGLRLAFPLFLLAACRPLATPTPVPLTADSLANAEYDSPAPVEGAIRLKNGEYHQPAAPGASSEISVILVPGLDAFGGLNQDANPDAAVILAGSGGGSGTFISLAAILNDGGQAKPMGTVFLGDRVQVKSVSIDSGQITVRLVSHSPTDPLCCPTLETTRVFQLSGDELVEVGPSS